MHTMTANSRQGWFPLRKIPTGIVVLIALLLSTCRLDTPVLQALLIAGIDAPSQCNTRQELSLKALMQSDLEGAEYFWICDRGTLRQQTGREVVWLAPENEGPACITLIASHPQSQYSTRKTITIDVQVGEFLVNGTVSAHELRTTLYKVEPTEAITLSDVNTFSPFPGLELRELSLNAGTNVIISYQISGAGGNLHLVTRLMVDGEEKYGARCTTGNITYTHNNAVWIGSLSAGSHSVRIEYRTTYAAEYYAGGSDWQTRSLTVLVLGS